LAALVDSNVILDLFADSAWRDSSVVALAAAANRGRLVINPIIYAEISVGYETTEILDALVPPTIEREAIPYDAAFLAGKAYLEYRRRGGMRRSPLPDFFIGAHAAVRGYELLTRDPARYRTYFPRLKLIAPN
jgi:predicted nucleic acid-binding protein